MWRLPAPNCRISDCQTTTLTVSPSVVMRCTGFFLIAIELAPFAGSGGSEWATRTDHVSVGVILLGELCHRHP